MSAKQPTCTTCIYMRDPKSRHPMCAHPEARRNPVDGSLTLSVHVERLPAPSNFCGPEGSAWWPSAQTGKPGMDGVSNLPKGV
jgi:hypothetical protein